MITYKPPACNCDCSKDEVVLDHSFLCDISQYNLMIATLTTNNRLLRCITCGKLPCFAHEVIATDKKNDYKFINGMG